MQKVMKNRKNTLQELIEKELEIYISELKKFLNIMKSDNDWANSFDAPKWIHSVEKQIETIEKEYSTCSISFEERETIVDKIFKEFENEDFAYRYSILDILKTLGFSC